MLSEPIETNSVEETESFGASLPIRFGPLTLVLLEGDLGAGKTTLVRGIARGLGVEPSEVTSPTFALLHEYGDQKGEPLLRHLDLYRVESLESLRNVGLLEILASPVPVVVEWPTQELRELPGALRVRIEKSGETGRRFGVERRPSEP